MRGLIIILSLLILIIDTVIVIASVKLSGDLDRLDEMIADLEKEVDDLIGGDDAT